MMDRRLKVLISAYDCSPVRGSEPGIGWGFVKALAEYHDLWVITEKEEYQDEVEAALREDPSLSSRVTFHYILKQGASSAGTILPSSSSRKWQQAAFQYAQQLHREIGFDLAHQLTMTDYREPGYLWQLPIPFVWGPVGGMKNVPVRFLSGVGPKRAMSHACSNWMNFFYSWFLQRSKKAAQRAGNGLITASSEDQARAFQLWGCSSRVVPAAGVSCAVSNEFSCRVPAQLLQIVWDGEHIPENGLNLAIKAMSYIDRYIRCELHVLGEGTKTDKLRHKVQRYRMSVPCNFHGKLSPQETRDLMKASHVLLITSMGDLASTDIMEALALGLPIICLDRGGFSRVVTSECGVKIPVGSFRQVADKIADAATKMWAHEDWRQELATKALERAHSFTWEKQAGRINEIYQEAVSAGKIG